MGKLLKTAPFQRIGDKAHYHIAYLSEEQGVGVTSFNDGHGHDVVMDPESGQWVIQPSSDGHAHDGFVEVKVKHSKPWLRAGMPEETEASIIGDVYNYLSVWRGEERPSIDEAREAREFVNGKGQWTVQQAAFLKEQKRAALTINKIGKAVRVVRGHQRENRTDIRFLPMEGGDQRIADLLNVVTKALLENCYYPREESKVFDNMIVEGRGAFNVYMDYSRDLEGELKVERFRWDEVVFAPFEKEDLSDCEGLIKHKAYSRSRLLQLFPEKEDELGKALAVVPQGEDMDGYFGAISELQQAAGDLPLYDKRLKEYRVLELWRKYFIPVPVAVVMMGEAPEYINCLGWSKADLSLLDVMPGVTVIEQPSFKMRVTKVVGSVLLSDDYPMELPTDDFFITPAFCERDGSEFWGICRDAIDPQRELNQRRSQTIDMANRAIASGWFIDGNMFPDDKEKQRFKKTVTTPGFVIELNDTNNDQPKQVIGAPFPVELVQLAQMAENTIDAMIDVSVTPTGANQSGQHFAQMIRQSMVGIKHVFDNLSFAKQRVGRLIVACIQKFYSPERLYRIVSSQAARGAVELEGQDFSQFSREEIVELLRSSDLSLYDVVVAESSFSPSARLANFMLMGDLAKGGVELPPQILIELADMPEEYRRKIIASIEQSMAMQAQGQEQAANGETRKIALSRGYMLKPEEADKLGLIPPGGVPMPEQQGVEEIPPELGEQLVE